MLKIGNAMLTPGNISGRPHSSVSADTDDTRRHGATQHPAPVRSLAKAVGEALDGLGNGGSVAEDGVGVG